MSEQILIKQDKQYKSFIEEKINEFNSNGKKTVVYFNDTYYPIVDGVIKVVENYATQMSKYFNVVLIIPKHKGKLATNENFLIIASSAHFFGFVNYDLAFPKFDKHLKKIFNHLRVEIVHSHSPFTLGAYGAKLAKKLNVPFVTTIHSQFKQDFKRYLKLNSLSNFALSRLVKVFNKSDELWAMHKKAEQMIKDYGYKGRVYLMPNATDYKPSGSFNGIDYKEYINNKYSISPDLPVFLFVGRLIQQKNIFFLADCLAKLQEKGLDFKFFFIGNGPDEDKLQQKIKELNLSNKVIFTGRINDKEELSCYYARSDLFLFPSVYDTSSIVQIESASLKTPVVFLDGTVTSATVTNGVNGYVSKPTIEDFTNTVIDAISDKETLKRISKNAYKDLYVTWDELGERIRDRYEFLINEKANF